jgi:hypothetical protein
VGFVIQASEHSSKRTVDIDEEAMFIGAAGGDLHPAWFNWNIPNMDQAERTRDLKRWSE